MGFSIFLSFITTTIVSFYIFIIPPNPHAFSFINSPAPLPTPAPFLPTPRALATTDLLAGYGFAYSGHL